MGLGEGVGREEGGRVVYGKLCILWSGVILVSRSERGCQGTEVIGKGFEFGRDRENVPES